MDTLSKTTFTPLTAKDIKSLCIQTAETAVKSGQLKKFTSIDLWNIQRGRRNIYKRANCCIL
jgi:hypothetical protein